MKTLAVAIIIIGVVSVLAGIYSRVSMVLLPLAPNGIKGSVAISFGSTCFLLSIALLLLKPAK